MSAKDAFFKKMEENQTAEKANADALKTTIGDFQAGTNEVLATIQEWFKGTSVRAETMKKTLTVESSNQTYPVSTLKLVNGNKGLEIVPDGLFFFGVTGSLQVTLIAPGVRKVLFDLHMKDSRATFEGWSIVIGSPTLKIIPFNQDNFFEQIAAFA